jgi:hypothetical protein
MRIRSLTDSGRSQSKGKGPGQAQIASGRPELAKMARYLLVKLKSVTYTVCFDEEITGE